MYNKFLIRTNYNYEFIAKAYLDLTMRRIWLSYLIYSLWPCHSCDLYTRTYNLRVSYIYIYIYIHIRYIYIYIYICMYVRICVIYSCTVQLRKHSQPNLYNRTRRPPIFAHPTRAVHQQTHLEPAAVRARLPRGVVLEPHHWGLRRGLL